MVYKTMDAYSKRWQRGGKDLCSSLALLIIILGLINKGSGEGCHDDCECEGTVLQCENIPFANLPPIPRDTTELELTRVSIPTLANNSFSDWSNLQKLVLDLCDIEEIEAGAFSQLRKLKELNLQTNKIKSLPDYVFKDLISLKKLILSKNLLTNLGTNVYIGLTSLTELNLERNQLTSFPDSIFHPLQNLETINLDRNKITSLPETVFYLNPHLISISLYKNRLAELQPTLLNNSLKLESINLRQNLLTTLSDTIFSHHYYLKTLNLIDNPFICDCTIAEFRLWIGSGQLTSLTAEQSGVCKSPAELEGTFLLNVKPIDLVCTTTTTTTTTTPSTTTMITTTPEVLPSNPNTEGHKVPVNDGLDSMTEKIIIASCVGGVFIIAMIIGIAICCSKRKRQNKPRQVKYILKPAALDNLPTQDHTPMQNGIHQHNAKHGLESGNITDGNGSANDSIRKDYSHFNGNYTPNIMPLETDLDEDLQNYGYDNRMYSTSQPDTPTTFYPGEGDGGMQFYNSLGKSINGTSMGRGDQPTPLSMLHRATPVNRSHQPTPTPPPYSATHRATPVRAHELSPYKTQNCEPPSPWRDERGYSFPPSYTQPATILSCEMAGAVPADAYTDTAYPSYINDIHLQDSNCLGKYSTGSADSGVHSNSPPLRARTPTDFSDHQISPGYPSAPELSANFRGSQQSLNKKTIKNETYV